MTETFEVTFDRGKGPEETYMFTATSADQAIVEAGHFARTYKRWRVWGIRCVKARRWVDVQTYSRPYRPPIQAEEK